MNDFPAPGVYSQRQTMGPRPLTQAQRDHLERIYRGVEFTDSIPEWRLIHMGLAQITDHEGRRYIRLTAQAQLYLRAMT